MTPLLFFYFFYLLFLFYPNLILIDCMDPLVTQPGNLYTTYGQYSSFTALDSSAQDLSDVIDALGGPLGTQSLFPGLQGEGTSPDRGAALVSTTVKPPSNQTSTRRTGSSSFGAVLTSSSLASSPTDSTSNSTSSSPAEGVSSGELPLFSSALLFLIETYFYSSGQQSATEQRLRALVNTALNKSGTLR